MKKIITVMTVILIFITTTFANELKFDEKKLDSLDYYLMNLNDQRIILDKNSDKKIYPASMTKIMTAIIVIENTTNFDKKIIVTEGDLEFGYDASVVGLQSDEMITVEDALHGMLLASGADAAHAVAVHMAGSEEEFVKIMNQKAQYLGLENTHYTNCSGIHDEDHYTTLKDLSILFQYCMKNEKFKTIMETETYTINPFTDNPHVLNSYHKLLFEKQGFNSSLIKGAKTGYTPEAGDCMISIAEYEGIQFLFASAEGPALNNEYKVNVGDAINVYKSFLDQYKTVTVETDSNSDIQVHVPKNYDETKMQSNQSDDQIIITYDEQELTKKPILKETTAFENIWLYLGFLSAIICVAPFVYVWKKGEKQ